MARDKHGSTYSYDKAIYVRMDTVCHYHLQGPRDKEDL